MTAPLSIHRWTVADPSRMSVVPAQEGDLVTYADHVAALAEARIEWQMSNGPALDFARGYAAALDRAQAAVAALTSMHMLHRDDGYGNTDGASKAGTMVPLIVRETALNAIDALRGES